MDEDDSTLITAYQAGDADVFGILYDRYIEKIYRFIYYKTFDNATAEDLTSSTFFKALNKIGTLDTTKGNFSAWLYSIARNTVIDFYRSKKFNSHDGEDVFDITTDDRLADTHDAKHALAQVTEYLSKLSASQREIVTLRIWEDRSYKEIAEIVGGTETSVRMSFSRTIRKLREDLGDSALLALALLLTETVTKV